MELKVVWCYLMLMLVNNQNSGLFVSAKNYETQNLVSCRGPIGDSFKPFLNATLQPSTKVGKCTFDYYLLIEKDSINR